MEKTKKSFGEFVLNVWVAIVRGCMAVYAVKSLTLKTNKNAQRYLLGNKKELKLIDKLGLADEELQERLWSHETKLELLRRGRLALLSEVKTEEELDVVLERGDERALLKALRVYTPSYEKMKKLCVSLAPQTLMIIAKNTPWVFDSLKPLEVLGAEENEEIPTTYERWQVAVVLAKARPSWAPLFLKQLKEIVPSKLGEEGRSLMAMFFNVAFETKENVSGMMAYFYVFRPDLYAQVRENWETYADIVPYVLVLLPQLLKYLKKNVEFFGDIKTKGEKLSDEEEANAWLKIASTCLGDRKVHALFMENIYQIKQSIQRELFNQMFGLMVSTAPSSSDLVFLYHVVEKPEETAIPSILVSRMERKEAGTSLRRLFPFKGWHEQLVTRAVKAMVARREFPVERIAELPEEMQLLAVAEMETRSQIEAIDKGDARELIEMTKLYPAAERYLLSQSGMKKTHEAYFDKWQIAASTFSWIVETVNLSRDTKVDFVFLYAKRWGVTEEQYLQVMQSWISDKAPFLKTFVKGQPAEA